MYTLHLKTKMQFGYVDYVIKDDGRLWQKTTKGYADKKPMLFQNVNSAKDWLKQNMPWEMPIRFHLLSTQGNEKLDLI